MIKSYFLAFVKEKDSDKISHVNMCREIEVDDTEPNPVAYVSLPDEMTQMLVLAKGQIDRLVAKQFDDPEGWILRVNEVRKNYEPEIAK